MILADYLTAGNPQSEASTLAALAHSPFPEIRARVAENKNCPQAILAFLSVDGDSIVRESVATNPNITTCILEQLVKDECADVRYALAEDHNLPVSLLLELCDDENPYVAQRARSTMSRLRTTTVRNFVFPMLEPIKRGIQAC